MSDINALSLSNQMRIMAAKAQGLEAEPMSTGGFTDLFQKAIGQVSHINNQAEQLKTSYEFGDKDVSIGEVMVAAQKSSIAFEATLRVRNKLVQAYKDIMDMPV